MSEIEVYRINPSEIDKDNNPHYYFYAVGKELSKKKTVNFEYWEYFAANPAYVGKFINEVNEGYNDNKTTIDYFKLKNGEEKVVKFNYQGTTCFIEVNADLPPNGALKKVNDLEYNYDVNGITIALKKNDKNDKILIVDVEKSPQIYIINQQLEGTKQELEGTKQELEETKQELEKYKKPITTLYKKFYSRKKGGSKKNLY